MKMADGAAKQVFAELAEKKREACVPVALRDELLLTVHGDPPESLAGPHWTDRLSKGEIVLSERSAEVSHSYGQTASLTGGEGAGSA